MSKKQSEKTLKPQGPGQVGIVCLQGILRIRFRVPGYPKLFKKSLRLKDSPLNRSVARKKAAEIETSISLGNFDPTLDKYFPKYTSPKQPGDWATLIEQWRDIKVARRRLTNGAHKYTTLATQLREFGPIPDEERAIAFIDQQRQSCGDLTLKDRIVCLHGCENWSRGEGMLDGPPVWLNIAKPVVAFEDKVRHEHHKPDEIRRFLKTARTHKDYSHYYTFYLCQFTFGCRPSELIGLRWSSVNFDEGYIHIKESLSRDARGRSNSASRVRKKTKNGKQRKVDLTDAIRELLLDQKTATNPSADDLVFLTPRSNSIDDRRLCDGWKKVCKASGVPKYPPYSARHGVVYRKHQDGWNILEIAAYLGNTPESLLCYGFLREGRRDSKCVL